MNIIYYDNLSYTQNMCISFFLYFSVNNKLARGYKKLHATPHALALPAHEDEMRARVWYGRMILAPKDTTVGATRQFLVEKSSNGHNIPMGIGCSSPNMKAVITTTSTSRKLDDGGDDHEEEVLVDTTCADGEMYCWFRCQVLADHDLTETTCDELTVDTGRELKLQCVNPRGQVHPTGLDQ